MGADQEVRQNAALVGSEKAPTVIAVAIPLVSFGLPILETRFQ
jgi:hypothetical protein